MMSTVRGRTNRGSTSCIQTLKKGFFTSYLDHCRLCIILLGSTRRKRKFSCILRQNTAGEFGLKAISFIFPEYFCLCLEYTATGSVLCCIAMIDRLLIGHFYSFDRHTIETKYVNIIDSLFYLFSVF